MRLNRPSENRFPAFSLVEMIGVMAVLALVVGMLVPATLRHLDRLAAEAEFARLRSYGDALRARIQRTGSIPAHTNWASAIALEQGANLDEVTTNPRRRSRAFLVDGGGWLSTNLAYTQTQFGASVYPAQARVMLVSSIGPDLPVSDGILDADDFEALWNSRPGILPADSPWNNWDGEPYDLLVHRVNLSPLFVRLTLTTYSSGTNGQFAVNASSTNLVPRINSIDGFFLKGSTLRLFSGPPASNIDSTQVLTEDRSFVYEAGLWRDSVVGRVIYGAGDVSGIVAAFLAATPNTNAMNKVGNAQQVLVVQSMVDYLSNYNAWAALDFPNGDLRNFLQGTLKDNLLDSVRGLYSTAASYNHYPTNGETCFTGGL